MGRSVQRLKETDRVYMLLTDRFYDGDPANNGKRGEEYRPGNLHYYQGGDWVGLTEKLPYIKRLGFTAIWMTAPQENETFSRSGDEAGYHGYYTKDFYHVNSHFGSEADLKNLIQQAEKLGIKVILDAQLNHTADYLEYPSLIYDPPEYRPAAPFDNPDWYHHTPNIVNFDDPEEARTCSLGGLDDLKQEHPACWQALMEAYWNPEQESGWFGYGFAGSRVDAVIEIPPEYLRKYEQHTGKPSFGEAFTGSVDENASIAKYMWGILDFPLYFQMNHVFCNGASWSGIKWVLDQDTKYQNVRHLMTFLDNHDRSRFLANADDNWAKLRLALAFQYAVRGIPIIYYGTEQNMAGSFRYSEKTLNDHNREMMTSFSEETTTFHYLKRLNELREKYKDSLVDGVQQEIHYDENDSVYAFSRRNEEKQAEMICIFNRGAAAQRRRIVFPTGKTKYQLGVELTNLLNTEEKLPVRRFENGTIGLEIQIQGNCAILCTDDQVEVWQQPAYRQTRILVHCDTGYGNSVFVRGDTLPLNWKFGHRCENLRGDLWEFVMERPQAGRIAFKLLLNDRIWESGENHIVETGTQTEVWPSFK